MLTLNSSIQFLNPLSVHEIKVSDPIYAFSRNTNQMYYSDGEELVLLQGSIEQWRITVGPMRNLHQFGETLIIIGENALW